MSIRNKSEIGREIQRLLAGRPQADLARVVGLDPSALSRIISGRLSLDLSELAAVANYFGVSSEYLLYENDEVFALRADCANDQIAGAVQQCLTIIDNYLLLETAAK
ncbi:MAG: helix-turn-helix domain-containing protein [Thermoleophilia bacterium]